MKVRGTGDLRDVRLVDDPGGSHQRPGDRGYELSKLLGRGDAHTLVEGKGFEPSTSALRTRRSPN